ncbi:carboxypeptidase regulatory-like domain-containing protein [Granulicella sibirica]|uniref:Copper binding protein, plastocyanin/azurin family n=1 Tax=Granulicella sibirica TaxID=2479048 RepID=A0A4Q0T0N9_9BACT|nr:carboxypeptidase regulatory-like domain-containing protein [Granulicella sibirica]RXH55061.1 Copper binding protein, plastocyanin/azurin family [Granulicella sibirica]
MNRFPVSVVAALLLVFTACKKAPSPASNGPAPTADPVTASEPLNPATLGDVTGTITFKGKAPEALTIDTSMDPACGSPGGSPKAEQYVVNNGKLANVFLYVKNGPVAAMSVGTATDTPAVLDQKGCVYVPHVIAIMRGGSVEFHNDDPTMHNIHTLDATVGNETVDISQGPHGAPQVRSFPQAENMIPVRCNNHPWMNAFINVSPTAFFAVSDPTGHFTLRGLPAGTYTIGAVHEKLGEQTMQITVNAKATATADFAFAAR